MLIAVAFDSSGTIAVVVAASAGLLAFLASVMAAEQQQRLRNSELGAAAGGLIGSFAAVLREDEPELILYGVLGAGVGAAIGWLVYMVVARRASKSPEGRNLLVLISSGLKGVEEQIDLRERRVRTGALDRWMRSFPAKVDRRLNDITRKHAHSGPSAELDEWIDRELNNWLTELVDSFNLITVGVFGGASSEDKAGARASLVRFGARDGSERLGQHWICYSGVSGPHKRTIPFDSKSIACQVLEEKVSSPQRSTPDQQVEKRGKGQIYKEFTVFRVDDSVVLTVDWVEGEHADPYAGKTDFIDGMEEMVSTHLVPSCRELLAMRTPLA